MRTVSTDERRRRLGRRHGLAQPLGSVDEVAESVVVLHATDPASVYLSALARLAQPTLGAVDKALYDDRSVVRCLAMRRTLFVVPLAYLAAVEGSSARAVAANERKKLLTYLAESGIDEPGRWLSGAMAEVEAALDRAAAAGGGLSARQITAQAPGLSAKLTIGGGSRWAVSTGATSRVLGLMAVEGRLVRGRPTGNWTTRQYQWHRRHHWLGAVHRPAPVEPDRPDGPAPVAEVDQAGASAALVERWLRAFGPAPVDDLKWWTGWTVRQVRQALAALEVAEVDLDGVTGLVLADDVEPEPEVEPWTALLPALDPTAMGWKQRQWYLGPHQGPLFDRSGNIGPTIWVDGRIVGGWGQRPDGSIALGLLEDVGADHRALIDTQAELLSSIVGATVVKPAFPTPLQKELST